MKRGKLKQERLDREYSRAKVAEDLQISVAHFDKLEAGTKNPGRDLLFKISKYYGKPVHVLFPDLVEKEGK